MQNERKHIRLTGWDYSSEGIYFITICCNDRQSYLAEIKDNEVILSEIGIIATRFWLEIPDHFPHVKLDEFIVMPNHIHGILILKTNHGLDPKPFKEDLKNNINKFSSPVKNSVSVIINQFKSSVKRWCNKNGFTDFQWQSRFYDHIVHDENKMIQIQEYIRNNPINWSIDDLNN